MMTQSKIIAGVLVLGGAIAIYCGVKKFKA